MIIGLIIFRSSVRKDFMAACTVCQSVYVCVYQSVKLLVHVFCGVHIFLTQRQIKFVWGILMPYNVGNIMYVCVSVCVGVKGH